MRSRQRARALLAAVAAVAFIASPIQGTALADPRSAATPNPSPTKATTPTAGPAGPTSVASAQRDAVLGKGWRQSSDRAWTSSGDARGFHILVADKKDGYAWRTAASLSEPGFDADMWIGNLCVTGSGRRAVVAYAPRTFTNKPELMERGAFTAVVNLDTGKVTKLNRQASLAYFSPGCGTGESAVFTQARGEGKNATRLIKVDAAAGELGKPIEVRGQVTSGVPVGESIVAADSARIVKINNSGKRTTIAKTDRVPFLLKPDAAGGVVYMDRPITQLRSASEAQGQVKRVGAAAVARPDAKKARPSLLAKGPLTKVDLSSSAGGHVFITGEARPAARLPGVVKWRPGVAKDALATTRGEALVTRTVWADGKDSRISPEEARTGRAAKIGLRFLGTGKSADFQVTPGSRGVGRTIRGAERSPALPARAKAKKPLRSAAGTVEDQRYCSVPRNDPAKQAMQPKPRQVEWAVDQAITGNLNKHISRPANWKNLGMGAYQPQTLFPLVPLEGGGRIPAQVMLGITAQESNMWQASHVVVPGVTGNPLIGNYYGIEYSSDGQQTDPWAIHWDKADCGYGVTQITDGMRRHGREKPGETPLSTLQQEAVALDYIAAGVNILVGKWNQTRRDGLVIDNGKPQHLENWSFALWAYNSGYYPRAEAGSNGGLWGVGFTNNPANPLWKYNRTPFLEKADGTDDYAHAAHPQDWPYQEKVLGWAARPLQGLESPNTMVVGYRAAWWTNASARTNLKPPIGLFCTAVNQCDPGKVGPDDSNQPGMGACTRGDLKCWWNQPVSWQNCAGNFCGNEILRFGDTYPEEADGTAYPPNCTTAGHPSNVLIIDDVPDNTPIHRPGCSIPKQSSGTFSLDFGSDSARIDLHQLGAGYTSHFWFTHTRGEDPGPQRMLVTGTWKLNSQLNSTAKVWAHVPDHGAQTKLATYEIKTTFGTRFRTIDQRGSTNRWVDLGAYRFHGITPEVKLSNVTEDGTGDQDIAFDAVAFVPGNYSLVPDITLPEADENAPDPEYKEDPRPIPAALNRIAGKSTPAEPPRKCRTAKTRPDHEICAGISDAAPSRKENQVVSDVCSPDTPSANFTRGAACMKDNFFVDAHSNGTIYQSTWTMERRIELNRNDKKFKQTLTLTPKYLDPNLGSVRLNVQFRCGPACSTDVPSWNLPPAWAPGERHVAVGTVTSSWSNDQGSDEFYLGWSIYGSSSRFGNSPTTELSKPALKIRCDRMVGSNAGCVFVNFIPSYPVNTRKYPAASAMYWVLMEKLPTHPGSKKHDRPLHRLADQTKQGENRGKMCKLAVAEFQNHPDTPNSSCDEYPFAATRESGGQHLASGKECVQLYATNKNGPWKLYEDDRYDLPTWAEICGRGSIPLNQNSGAGGDLGRFVSPARVLDGDPFYVETRGFENCDINSVCIVRPPS